MENQTTLPEATVDGSVDCGSPGSGGWCRGGASLSLSGSEPVSGYSIIGLEGTHNSTPFYCSGPSCSLPLVEGGNDFDFWAISSFGDTSRMGSAGGLLDGGDPSMDGSISGHRWGQRLVCQRRDYHAPRPATRSQVWPAWT